MLKYQKFTFLTLFTLVAFFLVDCQEKKKNNNALALGAVALALANQEFKVSGQVTLTKKARIRDSGLDRTSEEKDFYESTPEAILKIEGGAEVKADKAGYFTFPALKNGSYTVTVTRKQNAQDYPAISNVYDCTNVDDVNLGAGPFFLPTNCTLLSSIPRDSTPPTSGDYDIGKFTLNVNGTIVEATGATGGVDVANPNKRYNPLYINTSTSTYYSFVYDKAADPALAIRYLVSEPVQVVAVDTNCDRTKKECLQSLLIGTWLMQGSAQIPPNLLGFPEITFNTSALCYHATRVIARKAQGTDAVFSVENRPGTTGSYCNNDSPSSGNFTSPTVSTSVKITPVKADCFNIDIAYNLVRQEGRGKFSPDGKTMELELYNGGLNPSKHRCAEGNVGDTSAIPNGSSSNTVATNGASNPSGRPASAVQKYTRQ